MYLYLRVERGRDLKYGRGKNEEKTQSTIDQNSIVRVWLQTAWFMGLGSRAGMEIENRKM